MKLRLYRIKSLNNVHRTVHVLIVKEVSSHEKMSTDSTVEERYDSEEPLIDQSSEGAQKVIIEREERKVFLQKRLYVRRLWKTRNLKTETNFTQKSKVSLSKFTTKTDEEMSNDENGTVVKSLLKKMKILEELTIRLECT